jgi:uncharacterized protein YciI
MEAVFQHDFGHVRVHTDSAASASAKALQAHAFAQGSEIWFGPGEWAPGTPEGDRLLLHELTHVVQSDEGRLPAGGGVSDPGDRHEVEAYANEHRLARQLGEAAPAQLDEQHPRQVGATSRAVSRQAAPGAALQRGDLVRLTSGAAGVVLRGPLPMGLFEVRVAGETSARLLPSQLVQRHPGVGAPEGGVAEGAISYGLVGEEWRPVLVLRVTADPIKPQRRRAEALPLHGRTRALLGVAVQVVSPAPQANVAPTYPAGQEVYAQLGPSRWSRAQVVAVARPGGAAVVVEGSGGADGWLYTVALDSQGQVELRQFESDQLHIAEPQSLPGPTLKSEPGEPQPDTKPGNDDAKAQAAPADGAAQPGASPGGASEPEPAVAAPTAEPAAASLSGGPALVPPAPTSVMSAPPLLQPALAPVRVPSLVLEPGEAAFVEGQTGVSVQDNLLQVQSSVDEVVSSTTDGLQQSVAMAQSTAADASAIIDQAADRFAASATTQQANLDAAASTAQGAATQAVTSSQGAVDAASEQARATVDQVATQATSSLDQRATSMQQLVTARSQQYAAAFDTALEQQKGQLKTRLLGTISKIEAEALAQEQLCKAASKEKGAGGAEKRADEIAGKMAEVSVKKKYVAVMRTLADQVIQRIDTLKGDPMRAVASRLVAPTIDDLFPARAHYQKQLEANKQKATAETKAAQGRFRDVTTRQAAAHKAATGQVASDSAKTLQSADQAIGQTADALARDNAAQNAAVTADAAAASQQQLDALSQVAGSSPQQPLHPVWKSYVQQYQADELAKQQQLQSALADGSRDRAQRTQQAADQVRGALDTHAAATAAQLQGDTDQFAQGLASDATSVVGQAQSAGAQATQQGQQLTTSAATAQDEELTQLDADSAAYVQSTVQTTMVTYTTGVDATFEQLANKMSEDLQGAADSGREKERADRKRRADGCRRAAEHTWGTDEELYMESLSGVSAVQGYALQNEYQRQYDEGLRYRIDDETSGSLCRSLLAWTVGDEVAAVQAAMDYAANSFWGPDVATSEAALRGLSDEGRQKLQGNQEFEKNRMRMLIRCQRDRFMPDRNDTDALSTLSDLSQTREQATLMADAIRLEDYFNRVGTQESGAFKILGKRDAAGNQQLAEAYARYCYERENSGKKWKDLSAEERQSRTEKRLRGDIKSEMSDHDLSRANALYAGNKGLARAAQLQDSAEYINDVDDALSAMDNADMQGGETFMDRVAAHQEQANFLAGMQMDTNDGLSLEQVQAASTAEAQKSALASYDQNQAATSAWLRDEFGESDGGPRGNEDNDAIRERMLQSKLETGRARAEDLFAYGVDTTGTREKYVTQALEQIKGEPDTAVRMARLEALGGYCASFIRQHRDKDMRDAVLGASSGMARLPSWLGTQLKQEHPGVYVALANIMAVLDYESDGGEQFDFEILLAEAATRDHNVTDKWELARLRFLAQLEAADLDKYRKDSQVQAFRSSNAEKIVDAETASDQGEGQDQYHEGMGGEHEKLLAAHTLNCEAAYEAGKGVWFDAEGWLMTGPDGQPTEAAREQYRQFMTLLDRVERAATDLDAANQSLLTIISTIVTVIAGILITVVSFGAASAAAAGMISFAITLGAGVINMAIKYAVLGDRYGGEEFLMDLANTVADAALQVATLGAGKVAGIARSMDDWVKAGGGTLFKTMVGEAIKSVPAELKNILMNEDFWRGEKLADLFAGALLNIAKGSMSGTVSSKAGIATGLRDAQSQLGKSLENAMDSVIRIMTDPSSWDDDMGWKVLRALGEAGAAGLLGARVLPAVAGRLNAKPSLSDAEWKHISELPSDVRKALFDKLAPAHREALAARAAEGSALHAELAAELPELAPAEPRGKRVDLDDPLAGLDDAPADAPAPSPARPRGETWQEPTAPTGDAELDAHKASVDARAEEILAANPAMARRDAVRQARNEVLHGIGAGDPSPLSRQGEALHEAVQRGDAQGVLAVLAEVTAPQQRRELDLELRRRGSSLQDALASLPSASRDAARQQLDQLAPPPEAVAEATRKLEAVAAARAAMTSAQGDPEAVKAYQRARQDAIDHLVRVYGIDDTGVRARDRGERTGLQVEGSAMVSPDFHAGGDALARPEGVVLANESLLGAKDDGSFDPRSPGLVAAALAHEAEVHIPQANQGRMGAPLTREERAAGAPDTGTAVNEVEAYAFMIRNQERFGLTEQELKIVRAQLEKHLEILRQQTAQDPIALEGPLPAGMDPVVGEALRDLMRKQPRQQGQSDGVRREGSLGHRTSDPQALGRVVQGDFSLTTPAEPAADNQPWVGRAPERSRDEPVMPAIEADITGGRGKKVELDPPSSETGLQTPIGPATIDHDGQRWHFDGLDADGQVRLRPAASLQVALPHREGPPPQPGDLVTYEGKQYRVLRATLDGAVLQPVDTLPSATVPMAQVGPFQAYIAGQDGVWTVEQRAGKLVAVEVGGKREMEVLPSQIEPTIAQANIDPTFSDGDKPHGMGEMDVHRSVLRKAREQAGLDVPADGAAKAEGSVLDPRRGIGSASDVAGVKVTSSAEVLAGLADHIASGSGPLSLHWKRLQTEGGDPVAAAAARRVMEAVLARAEAGDTVTIYFGNEKHNAVDRELSADLRERLEKVQDKVKLVSGPEEGTGEPFNHTKTTVSGGQDPSMVLATGEVGTGNRIDASITLGGEAATLYAEYVQLLASGDTSPRRAEVLEQLAARGVAVNDPVMGKYYAAQSHVGLISDSDVAAVVMVKELVDPAVAERIVEQAKAGVRMDLTFRSVDAESLAILQEALARNPDLPINLRKLPKDVRWHGNATFGYDSAGNLQAFIGTNYLWSNQSTNQATTASYENGVVLTGEAAWSLYHQVVGKVGRSEEPLLPGSSVKPGLLPEALGGQAARPRSEQNVPLPTPAETQHVEAYLSHLQTLRDSGDPAARARAEAELDRLESLALEQDGTDGDLGHLLEHLDTLARTRARLAQDRASGDPGRLQHPVLVDGVWVEGMGRTTDCAATHVPVTGRSFGELQSNLGPPQAVEGTPPGRVRISWILADGSQLHLDVPGQDNDSRYEINRVLHVHKIGPDGALHLTEGGVGVPPDSTPAHLPIRPDDALYALIGHPRSP